MQGPLFSEAGNLCILMEISSIIYIYTNMLILIGTVAVTGDWLFFFQELLMTFWAEQSHV